MRRATAAPLKLCTYGHHFCKGEVGMYSNVLQIGVCTCLEEVWFGAAIVTCAIQKVTHGCLFTWFSMQKETHDCLWRAPNQALQLLIFLYVESSGICFRLSAVVFSRSVLSPVLENTSCCQEWTGPDGPCFNGMPRESKFGKTWKHENTWNDFISQTRNSKTWNSKKCKNVKVQNKQIQNMKVQNISISHAQTWHACGIVLMLWWGPLQFGGRAVWSHVVETNHCPSWPRCLILTNAKKDALTLKIRPQTIQYNPQTRPARSRHYKNISHSYPKTIPNYSKRIPPHFYRSMPGLW